MLQGQLPAVGRAAEELLQQAESGRVGLATARQPGLEPGDRLRDAGATGPGQRQ
jgi:hypothetical protein